MSQTIIKCGFQNIYTDFFRGKSVSKGHKLFQSHHVQEVVEIHVGGERIIRGKVIPQTRVNNRPYDVKVELNLDRAVRRTECTCKAGLSVRGCKHVAAVCIFINNECTQSKTDQPQCWNQPRQSQVEKYKKGCTIAEMFPGKEQLIDCNVTYSFHDVQNVPYEIEGSLFNQYLESEKFIEPLREIAREEEKKRKEQAFQIVDQIYKLQESRRDYWSYEVSSVDDLKMRLKKYTCPRELRSKYEENIEVNRSECLKISVLSEKQSDCFEWFEERAKRITCSSKAHRIKTRREAFQSLAAQFRNNKFDGRMTEAMQYGLAMEPDARKSFEEQTGLKVTQVGLIINITQPFMATSPDGIILSDSTLLEIKCPFTCKNQQIVNRDVKVSNVPYLRIDENNEIYLKKSDKYYTQIQVSMYILNVKRCHFFVYSSHDNVEVIVERDEHFLEELIPKIEWFYFKHYLPLLF